MAQLDDEDVATKSGSSSKKDVRRDHHRRRRHHHHDRSDASRSPSPSTERKRDWKTPAAAAATHHDLLPHRTRRGDTLQRWFPDTTPAPEGSRSRRRPSFLSPSPSPSSTPKHHRRSSSSSTAMPLTTRPSPAAATYRRGKFPIAEYDEDNSRSESRRSSRRDWSPPSAAQARRSSPTAESSQSARTSLSRSESGSDDESVASASASASTRERVKSSQHKKEKDKQQEERSISPDPSRRRRWRRRAESPPAIATPIYEETETDEDDTGKHSSIEKSRSPSRHSVERPKSSSEAAQDSGSSVVKKERHRHGRGASAAEASTAPSPSKRAPKKSHHGEVVQVERSGMRRANTPSGSHVTSSVSSSSKRQSLLGSFFSGTASQAQTPDKPVKMIECVICMGDVPSTKAAKLKCGHRMCNSCLKRSFKLSITDPQLMPPKCCTSEYIPLKHVERLFDLSFKKIWNKKFAEFSTRNRIYCPGKRCGEWIKPENIHRDANGRKVGKCGQCKLKVCCLCNGKWHASRDCPKDEETKKILQQAKEEGWQRCYRCRAMVELKEGCNHMTCRCGAQFCMICGTKWKGCDCPWFNYETIEADRLAHMDPPNPFRPERPLPPPQPPAPPRNFREIRRALRPEPPQTYDEEISMRRIQERRDESLARRLQRYEDMDDDYSLGIDDFDGQYARVGGAGAGAANDYRRRPQGASVPNPPPLSPFHQHPSQHQHQHQDPGPHHADYVAGVNRERGVRESSLERGLTDRLADRFSEHRQSPGHRAGMVGAAAPAAPSPMHPMHPMPSPGLGMGSPLHGEVPPPPPGLLRAHTMESDMYNSSPGTRSSERVVPGRARHNYAEEAAMHDPFGPPRRHASFPLQYPMMTGPGPSPGYGLYSHGHGYPAAHYGPTMTAAAPAAYAACPDEEVRSSTLAGLTGAGRGMSRVFEWRNHVAPGIPEDDSVVEAAKEVKRRDERVRPRRVLV